MTQPRTTFTVDPEDPRAPSGPEWEAMTAEEREQVVAALPSEIEPTEAAPPEGDEHFDAQAETKLLLRRHFQRTGRRIYVACNMGVYYPGERLFAPDVLAVRDVESTKRLSWIVSREGKGIDLALEIHVAGHRRKDVAGNVERYARLGVEEYFVWDFPRKRLVGYRLEGAPRYERLVPQGGRLTSRVLGLDLGVMGDKVRFFEGDAELPDLVVLTERLEHLVDEAITRADEAERGRDEAERRLAEALAELERLRRGGSPS